jgi:hypothetical protein
MRVAVHEVPFLISFNRAWIYNYVHKSIHHIRYFCIPRGPYMSKKTEYSQWDFLYKKGPLRITSMMVLVILCITQDRNNSKSSTWRFYKPISFRKQWNMAYLVTRGWIEVTSNDHWRFTIIFIWDELLKLRYSRKKIFCLTQLYIDPFWVPTELWINQKFIHLLDRCQPI